MATPIYASPIVDPQTDINQLNTVYTSEHLTENYNTFFNDKTENERLTYMPEGYEDQIDFDPFQSDYGLDFKSTLESEGFVNYVKNNPIRATQGGSAGPTVTVGGNVLSTGELRRRKEGPPEGRVVYRDEVLPFYEGQKEEDEGSVFDYWKSIPNISSFSEGLRGSTYGVTQPSKEEAAAAPVAQAPAKERTIYSPGGHPGKSGYHSDISSASYPDFQSMVAAIERSIDTGFFGIPQMESYAQHYAAAKAQGKSDAQASNEAGTQIGIEAFSDPKSGLSHYGIYGGNTDGGGDGDGSSAAPTPTGAAAHGAQSAGMAGMAASAAAAAAAAAASSAPGGAGHGEGHG